MKREVVFTVSDRSYVIKYPTVRQFLAIETQKAVLAGGRYGQLISSNTFSSFKALDIIDMMATLSVLCPDLLKDMKVGTGTAIDSDALLDLALDDVVVIMAPYEEQISSWINEWMKTFKKVVSEANEQSKTKEGEK